MFSNSVYFFLIFLLSACMGQKNIQNDEIDYEQRRVPSFINKDIFFEYLGIKPFISSRDTTTIVFEIIEHGPAYLGTDYVFKLTKKSSILNIIVWRSYGGSERSITIDSTWFIEYNKHIGENLYIRIEEDKSFVLDNSEIKSILDLLDNSDFLNKGKLPCNEIQQKEEYTIIFSGNSKEHSVERFNCIEKELETIFEYLNSLANKKWESGVNNLSND